MSLRGFAPAIGAGMLAGLGLGLGLFLSIVVGVLIDDALLTSLIADGALTFTVLGVALTAGIIGVASGSRAADKGQGFGAGLLATVLGQITIAVLVFGGIAIMAATGIGAETTSGGEILLGEGETEVGLSAFLTAIAMVVPGMFAGGILGSATAPTVARQVAPVAYADHDYSTA